MENSNDKVIGGAVTLTPKEERYLLFGKKKCLNCGGKLKKYKKFILVHSQKINESHDLHWGAKQTGRFADGQMKDYYYEFACLQCEKVYSLEYLANL